MTALDLGAVVYYLVIGAVVGFGWQIKELRYLTAESGLGYALGIVGGSMMLALLLYPLRKRLRSWHRLGGISLWFRAHMFLGIVGPVTILFHANFGLGSMNSTVAFVSMLLVAGSGLIGRYLYSRIHQGLYGRRVALQDLQAATDETRLGLRALASSSPDLAGKLDELQAGTRSGGRGLIGLLLWSLVITFRGRRLRRASLRAARDAISRGEQPRRMLRHARRDIDVYIRACRNVATFQIYERLFGLWHVFHLPLFFMMVITGIVHVFAVHVY